MDLINIKNRLNRLIVIAFLSFISFETNAQTTNLLSGYYGARYFFDLKGNTNFNWIANKQSPVDSKRSFQWAYQFSPNIIINKKIALGIDAIYKKVELDEFVFHAYKINSSSDYSMFDLSYSGIEIRSFTIIPKIEFSYRNGLLPLGFTHQLGFGFSTASINGSHSNYEISHLLQNLTYNSINEFNQKDINYQDGLNLTSLKGENQLDNYLREFNYSNLVLMYAINQRSCLSKSLMLNYGFRYLLNFKTNQKSNKNLVESTVSSFQLYNFFTFNIGLTYVILPKNRN